jgi:hypothetical protein
MKSRKRLWLLRTEHWERRGIRRCKKVADRFGIEGGQSILRTESLVISDAMPMRYGRIIRVSQRQGYTTYIVAEEDAAKAEALMRTVVGPGPSVQAIGRASLQLLNAVGLSAGEYRKTENY